MYRGLGAREITLTQRGARRVERAPPMLQETPVDAGAPTSASLGRSSAGPTEAMIFVSHTRRRVRAVNAAAGLLAVSITLWLVALVGGATNFVGLPALRASVPAPLSTRQRALRTHPSAAFQVSVMRAAIGPHPVRRHVRRALRS